MVFAFSSHQGVKWWQGWIKSGMTIFLVRSASVSGKKGQATSGQVYQEKLGEKYVLSLHIHLVMVCSLSGLPAVDSCAFLFRSKVFLGRSKTFLVEPNIFQHGSKAKSSGENSFFIWSQIMTTRIPHNFRNTKLKQMQKQTNLLQFRIARGAFIVKN